MSDLLFSFWLPSFYFSRDSHSGVAELTFSFDSASFWLCLIFWYPFRFWFRFLRAQEQKKKFGFLVFFTFFDRVAYDRIFFLKVPFRVLLTLMDIFCALKDKRRVLDLMKGYKIGVWREISWKGMSADEGFCCRQGQCRSLGQQSQWRKWRA